MSSEHLVHQDLEKGLSSSSSSNQGVGVMTSVAPSKEGRGGGGPWKCLSFCAFALLVGATVVFTLLQFGAFGQQDSKKNGESFSEDLLPMTMKVQAQKSGKPAAHAIASLNHPNELVWTTDVAPAMLENNMELDKKRNSLVVPSTGLYFVYSQLLFHKNSCPSEAPVLLSHTISCESRQFNTQVELLKSIKTACEASGQQNMWFESIYQGAVFKLYKGDHLWSKTEALEYLNLERQGQIYFGVIAI